MRHFEDAERAISANLLEESLQGSNGERPVSFALRMR
jgi:hypothetical protein